MIQIQEGGPSGVRLLGVSGGIRKFQVGKGQAVITAKDSSGNTATAACK